MPRKTGITPAREHRAPYEQGPTMIDAEGDSMTQDNLDALRTYPVGVGGVTIVDILTATQELLVEMQESRDYYTELADMTLKELEGIRKDSITNTINLLAGLGTVDASINAVATAAALQRINILGRLQSMGESADEIYSKLNLGLDDLIGMKEWNWELTAQIVEQLEAVRAESVGLGTSLRATIDTAAEGITTGVAAQLTTEADRLLTELNTLIENGDVTNDLLADLKRIKEGIEIAIGQALE